MPDLIRLKVNDKQLSDEEIKRSWATVLMSNESLEKRSESSVMKDEYEVLSNFENESKEGFSSYSVDIPY